MADEPITHIVTSTDKGAEQLTDPVINHAERIVGLEKDLGAMGERLTNQLFETERRLNEAISQGVGQQVIEALRERISALEGSISDLAAKVTAPPVQATAEEAHTLVNVPGELVGDVEGGGGDGNVEQKKESERPRGSRRRRKARRGA